MNERERRNLERMRSSFFALGSVVAGVLSFHTVQSVPWLIAHAGFGWFYVLYRWLTFDGVAP